MKQESGLVAVAWLENDVDPEIGFLGLIAHDRDVEGSFPVVRLSDAEAIIAKLRDALSETEAYHKRMVAAKDSEIERLSLYKNLAAEYGLSVFADMSKQSAALKLARELLPSRIPNGFVSFGKFFAEQEDLFADPYNKMSKFKRDYLTRCEEALAAINDALGE